VKRDTIRAKKENQLAGKLYKKAGEKGMQIILRISSTRIGLRPLKGLKNEGSNKTRGRVMAYQFGESSVA